LRGAGVALRVNEIGIACKGNRLLQRGPSYIGRSMVAVDQEEGPPSAAQDTPEQRRVNAEHKSYIHDVQKAMKEEEDRKWKERWKRGTKGQYLRRIAEEPDGKNRMLHAGGAKAHSALLTQLRTGKIGFNEFLYERRAPGVWNKRYACGHAAMSVRHVLLTCPQWEREREKNRVLNKPR
jgi:hypothetical protein